MSERERPTSLKPPSLNWTSASPFTCSRLMAAASSLALLPKASVKPVTNALTSDADHVSTLPGRGEG